MTSEKSEALSEICAQVDPHWYFRSNGLAIILAAWFETIHLDAIYSVFSCVLVFFSVFLLGGRLTAEIWLTEKYYEEFHERKGFLFSDIDALDVYENTKLLMEKWPTCIGNPPPVIGSKFGLFYTKHNWQGCRLRICFAAYTDRGVQKIIVLSCRTKQELSKGQSNGTQEWYHHIATVGVDRWDKYRRRKLKFWNIYP